MGTSFCVQYLVVFPKNRKRSLFYCTNIYVTFMFMLTEWKIVYIINYVKLINKTIIKNKVAKLGGKNGKCTENNESAGGLWEW